VVRCERIVADSMSDSVLILEAGRAEEHYWRDLWRYRELFSVLAWRDVAVRYKQTVIGVAWAVLRPFLTMVIFTALAVTREIELHISWNEERYMGSFYGQ